MGWSHKVWVWFWFLNLCRVHRCSRARLLFQRVKLKFRAESSFSQSSELSQILGFCSDTWLKWFRNAGSCYSCLLSSISWDKAPANIPGAAATRTAWESSWERKGFIPAWKNPGSEEINHRRGMDGVVVKHNDGLQSSAHPLVLLSSALQEHLCQKNKREFEVLPKFCWIQRILYWFHRTGESQIALGWERL